MVDFRIASARPQLSTQGVPFNTWAFPDGTPWTEFYRNDRGYLLRFPDLADFTVSTDGLQVACFPALGVSEDTSQHLYLNQVLPLILSKQGKLVFHASAVEVADGAIAFVAMSGRGKSTLAASFAMNGFPFLTDDGLVVETSVQGFEVLPSHPSIRLWDDSRKALITPGAKTTPALRYTSKARFLADECLVFCARRRPLRCVYFLGDGTAAEVSIQRMSAAETMIEWVKNSFLLDVEERPRLASHFDQIGGLSLHPIHFRLDYPRRFEELTVLRQAIMEHACGTSEGE